MLPDQFWHDLGPVLGLILAVLMFVVVPVVTAVASVVAVRRAGSARDAAERAVVLSEPTGNGFAKHVKDKLGSIELDLQRLRTDTRSDTEQLRREIAGVREDVADVRDESRRRFRDLLPRRTQKED